MLCLVEALTASVGHAAMCTPSYVSAVLLSPPQGHRSSEGSREIDHSYSCVPGPLTAPLSIPVTVSVPLTRTKLHRNLP